TLAAAVRAESRLAAGEVRVWDVARPARPDLEGSDRLLEERTVLRGHSRAVQTLAFSPDGKLLASAGGTMGPYGEVLLWDAAWGQQLASLQGPRDWVESLTFTADSRTLAAA